MKPKILLSLLLLSSFFLLQAQDVSKDRFLEAHQEITAMLDGTQPLDFEKAVFLTESAYGNDSIGYEGFQSVLDVHSAIIGQLIRNNDVHDWKQFVKGNRGVTPEMEAKIKERYRQALANWAIFTYLTDTLNVTHRGQEFLHLPYNYSNDDPFGTADWRNSQVTHLLETQKGNCYALATLFKIFSERFQSDASIVTAPQHIYIEHSDPHGNRFNVEVATRSFPDMGSIQTLTYTTREALLNDISMRKLDLKKSVGLSLVYLAKGYEYKYKVKDDEFLLTCANTALQHDPKNLNALLLKAQMYEQRVMKKEMPSAPYEQLLTELYQLGYRQMPDDMQNIILSSIQQTQLITTSTNKTPNPFEGIGEQTRYVTLSNGLFEELHTPQKTVRYRRTVFDTEKSKVINFLDEDSAAYQVDPVVFALSVDPLTKSYPWYTPYQFAGNQPIVAVDIDGLEPKYVIDQNGKLTKPVIALLSSAFSGMYSDWDKNVMGKSTWVSDKKLRGTDFAKSTYFTKNTVRYNPDNDGLFRGEKFGEKEVFSEWMELISHEEYHRMQYYNWSFSSYLITSIHDGFSFEEDEWFEQTAYFYGDANNSKTETVTSRLLNSSAVYDIMKSDMPEDDKVRELTILGLSFRLKELQKMEKNMVETYEKAGTELPKEKSDQFKQEIKSITVNISKLQGNKK